MANYREAFQAGLSAHNAVEQARSEVQEVLSEFDTQVHEASQGSIHIECGSSDIQGLRQLATALNQLGAPPQQNDHAMTLYAVRVGTKTRRALCELVLGIHGYPVRLSYAKEQVSCHDRESLELALKDLLQHPQTGGKLHALLQEERVSLSAE